jgi:hypothetical protein
VKDWEIIANNLSKAGWSWGCVSAVDCEGRTIWIADAHRGGLRLNDEFLSQPVCSLFYLQSITIIPIITTTAIHAAHMT